MVEIFAMYGNPFSRKNWKKNLIQSLFTKYYKRICFTDNINIPSLNITSSININPLKVSSLSLNSSHSEILINNKNQSINSNNHLKKLNTDIYSNNIDNNTNIKINIKKFISENHCDNNNDNDENLITIINQKNTFKTETTSLNHMLKKKFIKPI